MDLNNLYKRKFVATLNRIFVSFIIISIIILPLYFLWYPYPLNHALEVNKLVGFIIIINTGLAGLFTFFFYDSNRKDNNLNMKLITFIQILVFIYGFYYFVQIRPAWLVQHEDRINIIQPAFIVYPVDMSFLDKLMIQSWGKPQFKTVKFSEIPLKRQLQVFQSTEGAGIEYQPLEYISYDADFSLKYSKTLSELVIYNNEDEVKEILNSYSKTERWLPLRSSLNGQDMVVLINGKGEVLGVVNLKPWN
ncbi:hypothetical protein [Acinetobacter junii]|uniref:hypothetical protein n=1 Tax=Acinetobacter junii TaxID=40215 RepID=UPI003A8C57AC